jgi:hypothetical protein
MIMKKANVQVGGIYAARVSGKICRVRINSPAYITKSTWRSWHATNLDTGRRVFIHSAARLRRRVE